MFHDRQTEKVAPADRKLDALRDVTGNGRKPYLICASIMSKKLARAPMRSCST